MLEHPDHEADDLIGAYASLFASDNHDALIASNDFDFIQLVNKNIKIVRGIRNNVDIFDEVEVQKRFGVCPLQYIHYHALKGDSSDNLVSIKGIGVKTACKLIQEFGSIENVYANLEKVPSRYQKLLAENKDKLLRLKDFITIKTNIKPLPQFGNELTFSKENLMVKIRPLIESVY